MDSTNVDGSSQFTPAELTQVSMLWDRLNRRGVAPVVMFCIDSAGHPLAALNPAFTVAEAELIGSVLSCVMEYLNTTRA